MMLKDGPLLVVSTVTLPWDTTVPQNPFNHFSLFFFFSEWNGPSHVICRDDRQTSIIYSVAIFRVNYSQVNVLNDKPERTSFPLTPDSPCLCCFSIVLCLILYLFFFCITCKPIQAFVMCAYSIGLAPFVRLLYLFVFYVC